MDKCPSCNNKNIVPTGYHTYTDYQMICHKCGQVFKMQVVYEDRG
jgi:transcription elongation factor Elf1